MEKNLDGDGTFGKTEKSEKLFESEIHSEFNRGDTRLFRNHRGRFWAGKLVSFKEGIVKLLAASRVECGIGGDGGSDRIGAHQIVITPEMVGKTVAIFTAIELKKPTGGVVSEKQQKFIDFIIGFGGIAGHARSAEEIKILFDSYIKTLQAL